MCANSNNLKMDKNNKIMKAKVKYFPNKKQSCNSKELQNGQNSKKNIEQSKNKSNKDDIWFDDVDPSLIEASKMSNNLSKSNSFKGLTRCVAIDCEMVGVGFGGQNSVLARVSIVNLFGHCIYDKYVKPIETVTDYRTAVSGIRPENLKNGEDFKVVQAEVYNIIKDRILVGHSIKHDLNVLYLSHPKHLIRDTSIYFKRYLKRLPSLKYLAENYLKIKIQDGEHNSVIDAQATMRLYTLYKKEWEKFLSGSKFRRASKKRLQHTSFSSSASINESKQTPETATK